MHTKLDVQDRLKFLAEKPFCLFRALRIRRLLTWLAAFGMIAIVISCAALCTAGQTFANKTATFVASQCGCDEAALESAMDAYLTKLKICPAKSKNAEGVGGDVLCPVLGDFLTLEVSKASFFSTYSCTKAVSCVSNLVAYGVSACEAVVPFSPR